jgi:hypothetical protein
VKEKIDIHKVNSVIDTAVSREGTLRKEIEEIIKEICDVE